MDTEAVIQACQLITRNDPAAVVEVRILRAGPAGTVSGYFDAANFDKIPAALKKYDRFNSYISLQQINPALLARAANRLQERAELTTSDKDVIAFKWLPVDLDPVRPSGISSSAEELAAAEETAGRIVAARADYGLDAPLVACSGNGFHMLFPLPDLPNSPETVALIEKTLKAFAVRFDTGAVKIDQSVFNPGRIWRLYGTYSRKGDSIPERPHRLSKVVEIPPGLEV